MLMSADVGGLLTPFYDFDLSRAEAFTGWAQSRIVQHRLDSDPDLFSDVIITIKEHLAQVAADSSPISKRAARAMFSVLPPRMRVAIADDHAFAQAIDLHGRRSCGVGGFEFSEDEFFAAIEELRTTSEVVLTAMTGQSVRVTRAASDEGLFFDDGTERHLFPNDTFVTLAFKTEDKQREHLLEHPEIFDVADDALPSEVDKLLALPTWRERVQQQRDLSASSAASHYANLRELFGRANYTFNNLLPPSDALLRHYLPGYVKGVRLDAAAAFAPTVERANLLDVLRRAIAMPIPLPETLFSRLIAQPEPRRDEILALLREEAASPVARAHLAILGFASGTQTGHSLAVEVIGEMAGTALAARQAKLFMTVLRFVYWRLSRDPGLDTDVRLLLAWAHAARLVGIFLATGIDMAETQKSFAEIGEIFPDDFWTRSPSSLDVLHPQTATGGRTITAAIAHVAASIRSKDDAREVARKLAVLIYPETVTIPAPLLRDLSLGTNITGSFLAADLSEPLTAVNPEGAAILSPEAKPELLARAMRSIDENEHAAVGWTLIDAVIGNLPPPPDVRTWMQQLVLGPALEAILGSEDSIAAFSVLANQQPHFGDDYRQRVENLAISAITQWQAKKLEPDEFAIEANGWIMIGVALAARPESREQTGAALGRILRRFIDAAPAIAPFAATVLTILPFQLPMEYLPALWPAVIAARATPRLANS